MVVDETSYGRMSAFLYSSAAVGFKRAAVGKSGEHNSAARNASMATPANAQDRGKPVCSNRQNSSVFPAATKAKHASVMAMPIQ